MFPQVRHQATVEEVESDLHMLLLPLFCCIICLHIQLSDIFGSLAHALRSKVSFLYSYQDN